MKTEEEIPLLEFESSIDSKDLEKYYKAFQQFDHKKQGLVSLRVSKASDFLIE